LAHPVIQRARERVIGQGLAADRELLEQIALLPAENVDELLQLADDVRTHY